MLSKEKLSISALVIMPPESLWQPIQRIRRAHDKSFQRWPPHINLLYPFLPSSEFPSAAKVIREKLKDFEPFSLKLSAFGQFDHQSSSTVFLEASSSEIINL